jgi:hypothetical protein
MSDQRGSTAMLCGLCAVPAMLAVGVAIDYSRAELLRTRLRVATDSAALAGAGAYGINSAARVALATNVFNANIRGKLDPVEPTVTVDADGIVSVSATTASHSTLLQAAGIAQVEVSATSRANVPLVTGEIAMVLDYSSSMTTAAGDGKERWEAMRDAAIDLIQRLKNGQANPELKLALVPFARAVYLSLPGDYVLGGTAGVTWTNCTLDRKWPYVNEDSTPDPSNNATKWGRTDGNDTIGSGEYNDCSNYPSNGLVVRPLTNSHEAVISQLQAMQPHEGTNISAGMSIGWHVISPNPPFSEGGAYGSVSKTIILLTDGEQTTASFGSGNDFTDSSGEQNLVDMCAAIKARGVRVITVAFSDDIGTDTQNRLRNCATANDYYFNPRNGEELAKSFLDIAHRIGGHAALLE